MSTQLLEKSGEFVGQITEVPAVQAPAAAASCDAKPRPLRWTNAQFERMIEMGLLGATRAELIEGEIIQMSPMLEPHAHSLALTHANIAIVFPFPEWMIRNQSPFFTGEGYRPEPDLVIAARSELNAATPPSGAALIIEISDSTLRYDREDKASLYARADVADYWIVNVNARVLEVRRGPRADATARFGFSYGSLQTLEIGESIAPLAAPNGTVAVADLFG